MKKFLLCLCCLFVSTFLFANDTYFYMAGGQLVPTKEGDVDIEMKEEIINLVLNEDSYVRTITFPSKQITRTRIAYKTTYGGAAPSSFLAKYLYGTGSSWKNSIRKMTVRIQNNFLYEYPRWINVPKGNPMKKINDNTWEGVFTNVEPENLFWYTKPQLRLLRNAIYAFNGYPFKSPDLKELFGKRCAAAGWYDTRNYNGTEWTSYYPVDENFTESKLSKIEKENIRIILEEEKKAIVY